MAARRRGRESKSETRLVHPHESISPKHLFHLAWANARPEARKTSKRSARRTTCLSTLTLRLRGGRERERKLLSSSPLDAKAVYFPWKVRPHYAYSSIGSVLWTMSGFVTNTDSWYGHKMCARKDHLSNVAWFSHYPILTVFTATCIIIEYVT